jgi:RHS repeat-associated protein
MHTGKMFIRTLFAGFLVGFGLPSSTWAATPGMAGPQRHGVFEEPLLAASVPSDAEKAALDRAIEAYRRTNDAGDTRSLEHFLADHPNSAWRASLWLNIGLADRATGRYAQALEAFAQARRQVMDNKPPRAVGTRALSEQLVLETRLGHARRVAGLLKEVRQLGPGAGNEAAVAIAKTGLWDMRHHPETAFQCGWIALTALWHAEGLDSGPRPSLAMNPAQPGYSLAQLSDIASHHQRPMKAVQRIHGAPIPVPSIAHWKSGHFAAVLAEAGDRYQVADPVMDGTVWMSRGAVEAESSGYFLVPSSAALSAGVLAVGGHEAQKVRGAGYTSSNDPHGFPPCGSCECGCGGGAGGSSNGIGGAAGGTGGATPGGGSTPSPGMPTYSVSPMLISLTLRDTPLGYTPPKGPAMAFTLTYNQLDIDQPSTFTYGNVGPKWTHNWLGYVQDDPQARGARVLVYLPGGPGRLYTGFDGANGSFAPEPETGAQLVEVSASPVTYERRFPDGSKDIFAASDASTFYPRRIFLTQRVDAHGNAVKLDYDNQLRLATVTDALGQPLTFHYDDVGQPLRLTGVSDVAGRTTSLAYDTAGRLDGITDAIGMTSTIAYNAGTSVTGLTTPYGTTTFVTGQSGTQRWINITDVEGHTSRMEFNQAVSGVPFSESHVPSGINAFNRYINSRDSFYWDAVAYKKYPGDYTKAVIYHWSHVNSNGHLASVTADSLESIKYPLENRIWYNHPGDIAGGSGKLNVPSAIGRILPGGGTQLTRNSYNTRGKLVRSVDPAGLQTDYTYAPNQIDVVQIDRLSPDGSRTTETFTYDNQHNVLSHTDENGAVTQNSYNGAGQKLSTTDPLGHVTQYNYDVQGYLRSVVDANDHTTRYDYDVAGRLTAETDPLNRVTRHIYDALNREVRTIYPDGSDEVTTWDKLDRAAFRDRNGHTTAYAYDATRKRVGEVDPLGHATTSTYYPNGLLATRTDANGNTTTWQRDLQGRVTAIVDAAGAITTFAYDAAGRRSSVTNALGQTSTFAYDAQDRLVRTVDANGVVTDSSYTPRGWLATRSLRANADGSPSADDATTAMSYDAVGNLIQVTDPDGVSTTFTYDANRRQIATSDGEGNIRTSDFDAVGNLITEAMAAAGSSEPTWLRSYEFDAANQRVATIDADNHVTQTRYDASGRAHDVRDPLHIHTIYDYDPVGHLIRMGQGYADFRSAGQRGPGHDRHEHSSLHWIAYDHHDHRHDYGHDHDHDRGHGNGSGPSHGHGNSGGAGDDTAQTRYVYDAAGQLLRVVDPGNLATVYAYDPAGQLVRQQSPDTGITTHAYDAVGNRIRTVDARQVETDRSYDLLHRVTAVTYPSQPALNATYHYDEATGTTGCTKSWPVGHVSRMVDASGTTSYCYDRRGNVIAQHRVIAGIAYDTAYNYTPGNRLGGIVYPSGTVATYGRDANGRVNAISARSAGHTTTVPVVSDVTYLPFGPVQDVVYGDGSLTLKRTFDLNYQGTDIQGLGLDLHVRRDANGNIVALHEGRFITHAAEQRYRYDALQRLTDKIGPWGLFSDHYDYNATGDRQSRERAGLLTERYTYQPGTHRLDGIATPGWHGWKTANVLSDAAGNIVRMPRQGQALDLDYAANNRLAQVVKAGRIVGSYVYDANGLRAQKTTGSRARQFIYDDQAHLLGDYTPDTQQKREYLWLEGALVATLDTSTQGISVHYVGTDFLGTPRRVVNTGGYPVWGWAYAGEAFGDAPALGSYDLAMRFPGQYYDAETGLNYNLMRDYEPGIGRYLQFDPIGLEGGLNGYGYVGANPLAQIDPFGLCKPGAKLQKCLEKIFGKSIGGIDVHNKTVVNNDFITTRRNEIRLPPNFPCDDFFNNPFLVLHEYYHVLEQWNTGELSVLKYGWEWSKHGSSDGNRYEDAANQFAREHLDELKKCLDENCSQ